MQRCSCCFLLWSLVLLAAPGSSAAFAAEDDADSTQASEKSARLDEMKRQAAEYQLELAGPTPKELSLHAEPLLRFNNPVGGVPDGIVVMWKESERPAVLAQVFQTADKLWIHECQSLASAGLQMSRDGRIFWQPKDAAGKFVKLDGGPALADSPSKRLVQMRNIAKQFTASDDFKVRSTDRETTRHQLRLLPTPVYRYSDADAGVDVAAVFAFVHGTDPELFLVLEHRSEGRSAGWRYALAPMTCWAVEAERDGKLIWSVPERLGKSKPTDDYHVWIYRPQAQP